MSNVETKQLLNGLFGKKVNENSKLKQQACENIIEIVKLIDRITDISNMASMSYKPEQKEYILNKLYELLDFQIKLMEDNEDE